jgi:RecA/RadA recombinase
MPRSDSFLEPEANPLAPPEQLLHSLLSTSARVALGLALGLVAARLIRGSHLHWSWAILGLFGGLVASRVLHLPGTVVGVGALSAVAWGRRWHREDLDAGRDLGELARARRSPLDVLRSWLHMAGLRRRMRSGVGWFLGDELIVGRDQADKLMAIPFGGLAGGTHTLVLGATGSGKTMTQSWIAVRAIERGMGAIVVDPKGDSALREAVLEAAHASARAFVEWSPSGPSVYNPYARGTDTEIADKALAGERFTEPHYLRQAQRYLGHVVRALRLARVEVSLQSLLEALDPAGLERLARTLPEPQACVTHAYLDSLTPRQRTDLAGVRDRLAILAESDLGQWLDPGSASGRPFDLLEAVRAHAVVYFDLDSDSRPLLTQMLGAAIVQDLQTTVAALQGRPTPTLALIDEFSALSVERVVRLFGRARSAGVSLVLGTQELADLRLPAQERMLEQVMGNLTALIAHRQVLPESCALIASLAGTRGAWRTSRHSDGRTTRTRGAEGVLAADPLMHLAPGSAAVTVLTRAASARLVRIFSISAR